MGRASELENVRITIRQFKVGDFQRHVISCFPNQLQKIAMQKIKNAIKQVMVNHLIHIIKNESTQVLRALHLRLCTVCVSLYSQRRNWHAYEMKNPVDKTVDVQRFRGKLLQGCRINDVECDIDTLKHKDILWFTLIRKVIKKKKGFVRARPVFCAHILGTPYLFYSSLLETNIGKGFCHAFSCRSITDLVLCGRDIKSLHKILIRKEGKVASLTVPSYKVEKPKTIFGGRDYTQHENKKKFAEKCFPVDAKLQTLTLTNGNSVWRGNSGTEAGEDLELRWVVKISSPNVFSALKEFCENNLMEPEYATAYALRLGKEGKNKIQVPVITDSEHLNQ